MTFVLAFIGYSADMTITDQITGNMSIAFLAIPAVLIAIGIIPILMMKMKDSDVIEMRKKIEARKIANLDAGIN